MPIWLIPIAFPLRSSGLFIDGRTDDDIIHLVHHARDRDQVGAARPGNYIMACPAMPMIGRSPRNQRLCAAGAPFDQDEIGIDSKSLIKTFLICKLQPDTPSWVTKRKVFIDGSVSMRT